MELIKTKKEALFLDPFNTFKEGGRSCEIRKDPLTGRNCRILHFPIKEIPKPDINDILVKENGFCPFCPDNIEKITPKFKSSLFPKERYRSGEAVCFPNAFPYDENGSVTVMTEKHFVPISEFTEKIISDSISCCAEFLSDVRITQPEAIYQSINWNYLPLAGSSIIHPHLQITASSSPTNYYNDVLRIMEIHNKEFTSDLFQDLIDEERKLDERIISESDMFAWMVSFAPAGIFEILAVSKKYFEPSDLKGIILDEIVDGILKTINFIDKKNLYSYNMSLFFLTDKNGFKPHLRICPRTSIPPLDTCEINYMKMLHNEPMSTVEPETVSREIKKFW